VTTSMNPTASTSVSPGGKPIRRSFPIRMLGIFIRCILPLLVLAGGVYVCYILMTTGTPAERKPVKRSARLVEVVAATTTPRLAHVQAMGNVRSSRQIDLQSRVGGEIVKVSDRFVPGGRFMQGEVMLEIDRTDYDLVVKQREAALAEAMAQLRIERGNQAVAKREFELLGRSVTEDERDLVLRGPQLAMVEAKVRSAEASLADAKLDLERTVIRAPFNAIVLSRQVELGAQISVNTALAALAGTDVYWVEVAVPVNDLQWITIPREPGAHGSKVRITNDAAWGAGAIREGEVVGLIGEIEAQGRMARLLAAVNDPLGASDRLSPAMLIGSYVRVEIDGRSLGEVVTIPRSLLRDDDSVWVMNDKDQLAIRKVTVVFRDKENVSVRAGLAAGDRLVVSNMSAPVEGMALRLPAADKNDQLAEKEAHQ